MTSAARQINMAEVGAFLAPAATSGWNGIGNRKRLVTDKLLAAPEVARLLGVRVGYVYSLSRRGEIPTVSLGRYRRYRREAIDAWLRQIEQSNGHLARRRQR